MSQGKLLTWMALEPLLPQYLFESTAIICRGFDSIGSCLEHFSKRLNLLEDNFASNGSQNAALLSSAYVLDSMTQDGLTPGSLNLYSGSTLHRILRTSSNTAIFICSNTNPCPKHFLVCALKGMKVPLMVSLLNFNCISSTLEPHRSGMNSLARGPQFAVEVWTPYAFQARYVPAGMGTSSPRRLSSIHSRFASCESGG